MYPQMLPHAKGPAMVVQHPRAVVRLIDPETGESVDAAKRHQRKERQWVVASILAGFDDVNLRTLTARQRDHYLDVALQAMDLATKGPAL